MNIKSINKYYLFLQIHMLISFSSMIILLQTGYLKTIVFDYFMEFAIIVIIGNISYLFILGLLAHSLKKNVLVWVLLAFVFSGIGSLIALFLMAGHVNVARDEEATIKVSGNI